jgi:hypothetical protein
MEPAMENEYQNQPSDQAEGAVPPCPEDKWSEFERDLETLGHKLSELWSHKAVLGEHLVRTLQAQYGEVRTGANAWKHATDQLIIEIRKTARQGGETQGTFGDMRARSKATAFEMWERSEPLREGARDVGEGLVRAWAELRASIGKAANRLSASEAPVTRPADEPGVELEAPNSRLSANGELDTTKTS